MKIERTKNAARNILWGIVEKIITLLMPFLTRTVLIKVLGIEYLGLNSLFTSILQVLSISELGFGSAIAFSMYRPIAEDDKDLVCALVNLYKKVYHIIGSVILVVGLAITPFITHLINGNPPSDINVYILYLIYLANTVLSYFLFAYKQVLFTAHQRNDLLSKRASIVNLGSNILMIASLFFIRNYYAYVIIVPIATIFTNLLNAYLSKKMYPDIVCKGSITKEMTLSIKKRIAGLLSFKIYGVFFSSVDTIVISTFIGLKELAIYNNYYYVQSAIIGFMTIITTSITAGVGNKMVTNSREDNYRDFMQVTFMNAWLSSFCAVCLVCLYQHFMTWWVGEDLIFPVHTMILMTVYFFLPRVSTITYTYREAAGLWWEDRIRPLVAAVVNLGVNIFLVGIIGIDGVIISTLLCTVFINIPWGAYILFKNYFHMSPWGYYGRLILYTVVTAFAAAITWLVCSFLPDAGFFIMFLKGIICIILPNLLFLLTYNRMKEFNESKEVFFRISNGFLRKIKRS